MPSSELRTEASQSAVILTGHGRMRVTLFGADAPNAVGHFEELIGKGKYKDRNFYRVVADQYIQGGIGYDEAQQETRISRDPESCRKHVRGAMGFARQDPKDPDSAATEIYICLSEQPELDRLGFRVFGQVIEGLDVLGKIENVPVRRMGTFIREISKQQGNSLDEV